MKKTLATLLFVGVLLVGFVFGWLSGPHEKPQEMTEITETILWQKTEEKTVRLYHVKGNVATGPGCQAIAMKIYGIEGVTGVTPNPYMFLISISPLYKWSEVDSRIAGIVDEVKSIQEYQRSTN